MVIELAKIFVKYEKNNTYVPTIQKALRNK